MPAEFSVDQKTKERRLHAEARSREGKSAGFLFYLCVLAPWRLCVQFFWRIKDSGIKRKGARAQRRKGKAKIVRKSDVLTLYFGRDQTS